MAFKVDYKMELAMWGTEKTTFQSGQGAHAKS